MGVNDPWLGGAASCRTPGWKAGQGNQGHFSFRDFKLRHYHLCAWLAICVGFVLGAWWAGSKRVQ